MKKALSLILILLTAFAATADSIIVKNGAGFGEFLIARVNAELSDRWFEAQRLGACPAPAAQALRAGAESLRRQPVPLTFAERADFTRAASSPGALVSRLVPVLAPADSSALWIDRSAAQNWTEESIAFAVLTEAHLMRLRVPEAARNQAVACVQNQALRRYVSVDLKAYRQPLVGALVAPEGRLLLTDSESVKDAGLRLDGCGPRPVTAMATTALHSPGGANLRWVLTLQVAPACAARVGRALVVTLDFALFNGDTEAFLGGDRRVQLRLVRQNVQSL